MISNDACSTDGCEALKRSFATIEPDLVKLFADTIGPLAAPRRAASDLLLVTHPDLEQWCSALLSRLDFAQFTTTMLPFTVSTPSSIQKERWHLRDINDSSLLVGASLVNIESL